MLAALFHIDCWIFDLDNTLYPSSARIMPLCEVRMATYIEDQLGVDSDEAHRLRHSYFVEYGTTLAGLMRLHAIDPQHYLDFVHDVPLASLEPDPRLRSALERLPGRKLVFTNADAAYAGRVLEARGLAGCFEAVHDIVACGLCPKPEPAAYASLIDALDVDPRASLFVDDMARNLAPAKALGMATVWMDCNTEHGEAGATDADLDYRTDNLTLWLESLLETEPA